MSRVTATLWGDPFDHRLWLARYTHMLEAVAQRRDAPQLFQPGAAA